jgi:hypothetical protein
MRTHPFGQQWVQDHCFGELLAFQDDVGRLYPLSISICVHSRQFGSLRQQLATMASYKPHRLATL